jgi:hypothetical protein
LATIEKLNSALCRVLAGAAIAPFGGSSANAAKLNADTPNHCLTEPDIALDFMTHDLCRTATDANDSQFQSLHGWHSVLPQQKVEIFFLDVEVFDLTPSLASQLLQGTAFNL